MKSNTQIVNLLLLTAVAYTSTQKKSSKPSPSFRSDAPLASDRKQAHSNLETTPASSTREMTPSDSATEETPITKPNLLRALYAADEAVNMSPLSTGPFSLPALDYDYNALEPYIDEETMRIHHLKHHKTYVDNLNAALARHPEFYNLTLDQLLLFPDRLPSDIQTQVVNNAGGHYNHSLMWKTIDEPSKSRPTGSFAQAVSDQFGSFENLKRSLKAAGESVFGSGYAYLVLNPYGRMFIVTTNNQATPILLRTIPLLPIDMWEHAYYLKHQNNRSSYLDDYLNVVNWSHVGDRYEAAMKALQES